MPHQTNQQPSGTGMQGFQHQFPHPDMQYPNLHPSQHQTPQPMLPYHPLEAGYPLYNMTGLQQGVQQRQMQFQGNMQKTASTTLNTKEMEKESISQTDEEAAATALLMSAGAPTHMQSDNKNKTPKKDSAISKVCQVSPGSRDGTVEKSPETSDTKEQNGDSITREMRQKELATIEDFPGILHGVLCDRGSLPVEDVSRAMRWMPCGKSWKVDDWQKLGDVLAGHSPFPEISNVDEFLTEVEAWGFQKVAEEGGAASFQHEFFIKIAPNLCKYMRPKKENLNVSNQIASPPRLGRYGNDLNRIINGKRNKDPQDNLQETKLRKLPRVDDDGITIRTPSVPVTPSFTLSSLVSPSSDTRGSQVAFVRDMSNTVESGQHQPQLRLRLQSNRGGRHNRGHLDRPMVGNQSNEFVSVSKRGRRYMNVSSRGGRAGKNHMVLPKMLAIPFTCGGDSTRPLSPRPN